MSRSNSSRSGAGRMRIVDGSIGDVSPTQNDLVAPNQTRNPVSVAPAFDPAQVALALWNKWSPLLPVAVAGYGVYKLYRGRRTSGLVFVGAGGAIWLLKKLVSTLQSKAA